MFEYFTKQMNVIQFRSAIISGQLYAVNTHWWKQWVILSKYKSNNWRSMKNDFAETTESSDFKWVCSLLGS